MLTGGAFKTVLKIVRLEGLKTVSYRGNFQLGKIFIDSEQQCRIILFVTTDSEDGTYL